MAMNRYPGAFLRTFMLLSVATLLWRCKKDVGPPLTGLPLFTPKPPATLTPTPAKGLSGSFRVVPQADPNAFLQISQGSTVEVNAAAFRDGLNGTVNLATEWGDGSFASSDCGPCRVTRVFSTPGTYTITAEITDASSNRVRTNWTVMVGCAAPGGATYSSGLKTFSWSSVPGATSYNVYVKTVPSCNVITPSQGPTKSDSKSPKVTSPFDASASNKCNTCYYINVSEITGYCESILTGGVGFTPNPTTCTP
jgi:PKD domain